MEGWNILHLEKGIFEPDPAQSETWNRGAYIVEGLGHCGACHTPRNAMGAAPKSGPDAYAGGYAEGWYAPPLTAATTAPIPWTEIALVNYLIDGWDADHGIVAGPMKPVVNDLYEQSEDDVFAIAAYIMHLKGGEKPEAELDAIVAEARARADKAEWGHPEAPPVPDDPQMAEGARIFEAQCATCHKAGGLPSPLGLGTSIWSDEPANLVRITFEGNTPGPLGSLDRAMPGRANQISDAEMAALAAFMRARYTERPAWPADLVARRIAEARADLAHRAAGGH
jgi:mono/diheme cytochrome c family protein